MKYLFLEPHPDDTSLSAFFYAKHIKYWGNDIYVASVCNKSVKNKYRDSKKFCDIMDFNFIKTEFADQPFFAEHRLPLADYKNADNPFEYVNSVYHKNWGEIAVQYDDIVKNTIEIVKPDFIVTTMGILHLAHIFTRYYIEKYFDNNKIMYYADSPYQWRAYGRPFIEKSGLTELTRFQPKPEEIENKLNIFEKCYPSEKYMITMDKYLYYRYPELIFKK